MTTGRGDDGFLVLVVDTEVALGDVVEVSGMVGAFDPAALSADLEFNVDPEVYSPGDRQHVASPTAHRWLARATSRERFSHPYRHASDTSDPCTVV